MANSHANHHHHHHLVAVVLVFFLLVISSSARPLNDFSLAATEPTLNLALPSDGVMPEKEVPAGHVSPCDHMRVTGKPPSMRLRRGGGKYGPMILNMLPKGTVPPSGPSKGTNDLNH